MLGVGSGDNGAPVWLAVGATTDAITPLGILFGADIPQNANTCTSSYRYWCSSFERMGTHLNRRVPSRIARAVVAPVLPRDCGIVSNDIALRARRRS